jgi:hypothetical protein
MMGVCGLLVLGGLGCRKVSKDNGVVVATVGGDKITEGAFAGIVNDYLGDPVKAKDLLTNPAQREQRNQFLGTLVNQRALLQYAKAQGLDKDPKAKLEVESAVANAYFQLLADRLMTKAEPTDADLRAFYDAYVAQAKAAKPGRGPARLRAGEGAIAGRLEAPAGQPGPGSAAAAVEPEVPRGVQGGLPAHAAAVVHPSTL